MDEKRLTIERKTYALILCTIVFMMVYNFAAWYLSTLNEVPSFVFGFEKYIPFIPWSIIPYMTSGIFFCAVFFFCQNKEQLKVLTQRMLFVTIVAGLCFLLFPLKFSLPKPEVNSSFPGYSFYFLKTFDSPFNQAPSLHIAYAFIFWSVFRNLKRGKTLLLFWLILLGISTLTTYQHHCIDIITGSILAHFSFIIFPYRKNDFLYRNFQVANIYFLLGWVIILAALLMNQFSGNIGLFLLWPGIMTILIGYHYQKNNIYFLKDKKGNIPWIKKVFYSPYLLLYQIFWKFFRKNKIPVEILQGLYISSRPDRETLNNFGITQKTFVYDLSAEMEELSTIKDTAVYRSVSFLDIGTLDIHETQKLVSEITEKHKQLPPDENILIHCTMGFTRSSVIGILVMKNILSLPLTEAITLMKTLNKHAVIHTYLEDFLKKF
ncbi:phosphatase PAP2 family protein [Chryseobacterium sp.]|jgi:membrane-associated phospholipid phosphatase|uniref:phosphatase PAP2 family protein n=1 Tax=Chryseobacterium sp. TaxID=1871047 RepID=UPI00283B64D6|nr:phosphatase PAP2 family protein [Chryseobacterium sp.]MDR3025916.1 phosphatase PAP2 family protein [Chryseobacterium sp.]